MFNIILLIFWIVLGMCNLCSSSPISKLSYFCTWIVVVAHHISMIVT